MPKKTNPEFGFSVLDMAEQGRSDSEIAGALGVNPRTVLRWRTELGIKSRYRETHTRTHGTASTYAIGCRCQPCTLAHKIRHVAGDATRRERTDSGQMPASVVHNASAYKNWGCRCAVCAEDHSAEMKRQRANRIAKGLSENDPRHGTTNAYNQWNCRCLACRTAAADRQRAERSASRA